MTEIPTGGKIQDRNRNLGSLQRGVGGAEVFSNAQGITCIANKIDARLLLVNWFGGLSKLIEPALQSLAFGVLKATLITW